MGVEGEAGALGCEADRMRKEESCVGGDILWK